MTPTYVHRSEKFDYTPGSHNVRCHSDDNFVIFLRFFVTERGDTLHQYVDNSPKSCRAYGDVYVKKVMGTR